MKGIIISMKHPKVSVVLALYNGLNFIQESIESIQSQTFSDWELIVVNELGSDDGCGEIVKEYSQSDSRIRFVQNTQRLGLAESLNIGIGYAQGEYIARVDVDDPSYVSRFEQQVNYLDGHTDVFMCGTLQRSVLPHDAYILNVPCAYEELKAAMLFGCEISHCSVMFRKKTWDKCGFRYDRDSLCEDYDLWTKIIFEHKIVNLPEPLVDHRWGFNNISIAKGEKLLKETRRVSRRTLKKFDIDLDEKDDFLVAGWRNEPREFAQKNPAYFLRENYKFLSCLIDQNHKYQLVHESSMLKIMWKRWNWVCHCLNLFFFEFDYEDLVHETREVPTISAVMPVYGAVDTIRETIDSIIRQKYKDWELIIVCDSENWDGSTEIAKFYSLLDKRIRVICNCKQEGLAESLNIGIRAAKGKYIARIDADDLSNAARFETQLQYMEEHSDVGITQFYQHYFGEGANDFIHRPPVSAEAMKAKLLFFCDACHSTIMMRKDLIEKYGLYYDPMQALEDYELWSRAIRVTKFVTIPEVYGEYRVGGQNISNSKQLQIQRSMTKTVATQLEKNLGIVISENNYYLLNGWKNIFHEMEPARKEMALHDLKILLLEIWKKNKVCHFYNEKELLKSIAAKWRWSKYNISWHEEQRVRSIGTVLELHSIRKSEKLKAVIKKPLSVIQRIRLHTDAKSIEHLSNVIKDVSQAQMGTFDEKMEWWTWERYQRIENQLVAIQQQNEHLQQMITDLEYKKNKTTYVPGEKIRIVFLYQIASFWASWESLYHACMQNANVDAQIVFLDETNTEKSQMKGAEQFLINSGIPYTRFEQFSFEDFQPHVLIIQTPYDEWHRQTAHWSNRFKQAGYRLVYIPYGVEISDTDDSHKLHFRTNVIENCWRIYTFSDAMKMDYWRYCANRKAVRAVGLPRFDYYFNHINASLPDFVEEKRSGRKVIAWKVHFPKWIMIHGVNTMVTPDLDEYISFARRLKDFQDFFFVFIPHPKFMEDKGAVSHKIHTLIGILSEYDNVWIDYADDYRNSLSCADYVIIDRSAVMVEAGALNVPVCYVSNNDYYEPLTNAIEPLINSYYQANNSQDMVEFVEKCRKDTVLVNKEDNLFARIITHYDGKCGQRVLDDIVEGVINEAD